TDQRRQQVCENTCVQQDRRDKQNKWNPSAACVGQPAAGKQAARAARKQHKKDNDGERVSGMAQKKYEALNECDLHQDVTQAHGDEVKQRQGALSPASMQSHRQQQEGEDDHDRNQEHDAQYDDTEVYLPVDALLQSPVVENLVCLQGKEKEGAAVVDGGDVVGIVASEGGRIISGDQSGKGILARLGGQV